MTRRSRQPRGAFRALVLISAYTLFPVATFAQDADSAEDDVVADIDTVAALYQDPGPYNLAVSVSYDEKSGNSDTQSGTAGVTLYKFWDAWGLYTSAAASHQKSDSTD